MSGKSKAEEAFEAFAAPPIWFTPAGAREAFLSGFAAGVKAAAGIADECFERGLEHEAAARILALSEDPS